MLDFTQIGLQANIGIFVAAAVVVWLAGGRLSRYADAISRKTGVGQAMIGLLLLAGVTSLPEIAVTVTAAVAEDTQLAVNNLFGSIAMQVTILALIDFTVRRRALTAILPSPVLLLQGNLNVLLLTLAAAAMVVGDVGLFGVGAWSTACFVAYLGCAWILSRTKGRSPWLPAREGGVDNDVIADQEAREERHKESRDEERPLRSTVTRTAIAALLILAAGYLLSQSGSAIAEQTGLGSSFVGFVLIAMSTSLPELSTALSAARLGRFTMAISDILGTNLINVGLVFLVDLAAPGELAFNQTGSFASFGALLGIVLTAIFLVGLTERRNLTVGRIGLDSAAVVIGYVGGVIILYGLR
jgi:cation:H+ antiporter